MNTQKDTDKKSNNERFYNVYADTTKIFDALLSDIFNADIVGCEDAETISAMKQRYIENRISKEFAPYIRKDSRIVYYCKSLDRYKARIPKALRVEGKTAPQSAKTECEMWQRLYIYLYDSMDFGRKYSLSAMYGQWITCVSENVTSKTVDKHRQTWNRFISGKDIASVSVRNIDAPMLMEFLRKTAHDSNLSRKELSSVKTVFNGIFDLCVERGIMNANISRVLSIRNIRCRAVNNNEKVYSDAERERLLDYLDGIPDTVYSLGVVLMFCMDVRIGELRALKWSDYNESAQTLSIERQIVVRRDENGKNRDIEVPYTKGGDGCNRVQPVSERARATLARLRNIEPTDGYILANPDRSGNFIKDDTFNKWLKKFCQRAGVPYMSSHKIRFWAVSAMARAGMDLDTIMYNSGHKDKNTTLHYIRHAKNETVNTEKWGSIFN